MTCLDQILLGRARTELCMCAVCSPMHDMHMRGMHIARLKFLHQISKLFLGQNMCPHILLDVSFGHVEAKFAPQV